MKLLAAITALFFAPKTKGFPHPAHPTKPVTLREIPHEVTSQWTRNRVLALARSLLNQRAAATGATVCIWRDESAPPATQYRIGLLWPASQARLAFFAAESWPAAVNAMTAGRSPYTTSRPFPTE